MSKLFSNPTSKTSQNSQRKTSKWFLDLIEENDGFPVEPDDNCTICLEPLDDYDYLRKQGTFLCNVCARKYILMKRKSY